MPANVGLRSLGRDTSPLVAYRATPQEAWAPHRPASGASTGHERERGDARGQSIDGEPRRGLTGAAPHHERQREGEHHARRGPADLDDRGLPFGEHHGLRRRLGGGGEGERGAGHGRGQGHLRAGRGGRRSAIRARGSGSSHKRGQGTRGDPKSGRPRGVDRASRQNSNPPPLSRSGRARQTRPYGAASPSKASTRRAAAGRRKGQISSRGVALRLTDVPRQGAGTDAREESSLARRHWSSPGEPIGPPTTASVGPGRAIQGWGGSTRARVRLAPPDAIFDPQRRPWRCRAAPREGKRQAPAGCVGRTGDARFRGARTRSVTFSGFRAEATTDARRAAGVRAAPATRSPFGTETTEESAMAAIHPRRNAEEISVGGLARSCGRLAQVCHWHASPAFSTSPLLRRNRLNSNNGIT